MYLPVYFLLLGNRLLDWPVQILHGIHPSGSFSLSPSFLCFKGPMFILFNFVQLPQILLKVYGMKGILNKSVTESF